MKSHGIIVLLLTGLCMTFLVSGVIGCTGEDKAMVVDGDF